MTDLITMAAVAAEILRAIAWLAAAVFALLAVSILWILASDRLTRWWRDRRETRTTPRPAGDPYDTPDALTPEQRAAAGRLLAAIHTPDPADDWGDHDNSPIVDTRPGPPGPALDTCRAIWPDAPTTHPRKDNPNP